MRQSMRAGTKEVVEYNEELDEEGQKNKMMYGVVMDEMRRAGERAFADIWAPMTALLKVLPLRGSAEHGPVNVDRGSDVVGDRVPNRNDSLIFRNSLESNYSQISQIRYGSGSGGTESGFLNPVSSCFGPPDAHWLRDAIDNERMRIMSERPL